MYLLVLLTFIPQKETTADTGIKELYITCPVDSFNFLYENYTEDHYITISLVYDNRIWTNVKLRIRGDTSRKFPKKSLKLVFENQPFLNNRDKINLNADYFDKSYIHAYLSSRLFRITGHPCPHMEHVNVFLNNAYLGLYILVENMDKYFLDSWQLDRSGNLYKASRDNACLSIYDDVYNVWEKKTNEDDSWSDLTDLIQRIDEASEKNFDVLVKKYFNYEKFINILAINMLTANGSTYYHNYYLYHDANAADQWMIFPWDLDKTFSSYGSGYQFHRSSTAYNHDNPLLEKAIINPVIVSDIQSRIKQLSDLYFNNTYLDPLIDSLQSVLTLSVHEDNTDAVADSTEWISLLNIEKTFISERAGQLLQQFSNYPKPFRASPTPDIFTGTIRFHWQPSAGPNGEPVSYLFMYSKDLLFKSEETKSFSGITDTLFTLPENPDPGTYYWIVYAICNNYSIPAYDSKNTFTYTIPSILPASISGTMHLTKDNSPYLANSDVTIYPTGKLTTEPGVEIRFAANKNLFISGNAEFSGTGDEPVTITSEQNDARWGALCIENTAGTIHLNHVIIKNAGRGSDRLKWKAAITSYFSTVRIENVILENVIQPVYTYGGNTEVIDCRMQAGSEGDILNLRYGNALVRNCYLYGSPAGDAIDYDHVINGLIEDNTIFTSNDDGIDIGESSRDILIQRNFIQNCSDKAISIGEQSTAQIYRNCIIQNNWGVAIKDSSYVFVDHNTFYQNNISILSYEKVAGEGPGKALVTNNIFSQSRTKIFETDSISTLTITYSLSDTDTLPGQNNIKADPVFVNAALMDFRIKPNSPCINHGDPAAPLDPDGTRSDIGVFFFNLNAIDMAVINEINYNSSPDYDTGDWMELINLQDSSLNISGWQVQDRNNEHIFVIPKNTTIATGGYIVLCRDTSRFFEVTGLTIPVIGNINFGLNSGGEVIKLYDPSGALVDSVKYEDSSPWPTEPDGSGMTLELIDYTTDNNTNLNWGSSLILGGTPGNVNSLFSNEQFTNRPLKSLYLLQNYPNPFNNSTTFTFTVFQPGKVEIIVYDLLGRVVNRFEKSYAATGTFTYEWQASGLSSGIYFFMAKWNGNRISVKKAVLLK